MIAGIVIGAVALILIVFVSSIYNRLVRERNSVDSAFATIDVQLKQRCDLIPQLVTSVRGAMEYEKGTLEKLTELRERASAPGASSDERMALDSQMSGLLHGLFARVEAYPQLKANESVVLLQRSLNETEAQIAAARRTYNAAVTIYNTSTESVPSSLIAGPFGFARRTLFEAAAAERAVPTIGSFVS